MNGGDAKSQLDISELIADHDAAYAVDLAVLLDDAVAVSLSELVGAADPSSLLRVEPSGLGEVVAPAPAAEVEPSGEAFSQPMPMLIIFDDTATDPTTAI